MISAPKTIKYYKGWKFTLSFIAISIICCSGHQAFAQDSPDKIIGLAYDESNPYKSLELLEQIEDSATLTDTLHSKYLLAKGVAYGKLGAADSSEFYLDASIAHSKTSSNDYFLARAYNSKGVLFRILGRHEESLNLFQQSLAIAEPKSSGKFEVLETEVLGNIGGIFFQLKKYPSAIEYSNRGLQKATVIANTSEIAYGNLRLAIVYQAMDSLDKSLAYNKKTSELLEIVQDFTTLVYVENTLGTIRKKQGKLDSSLYHQKRALEFAITSGEIESVAHTTLAIAEVYLAQKNLNAASTFAKRGLAIANEGDFPIHTKNAHDLLYRIAMAKNNPREALTERNAFIAVSDSLNAAEAQERLAEVEARYQTEKKEAEITRLSLENELQEANLAQSRKIQLIVIIGASILLALSVVIGRMYWQKSKIKERLLVVEVNDLRNQIKMVLETNVSPIDLDYTQVNTSLHTPLSEREFEILKYALTDLSNNQIADKTFVSVNTVKFHLKNIYEKIGVGNRKEALQFAISATRRSD
ncbi:MAG: tetratricopeptide repeat protein [Cyclobacteriaceae bacterium]